MIPGFGEVSIIRPGYAIEYDFVDPRELGPDLQTRRVKGLFHAGQINGTTGYEEAACQGLLAGINAARFTQDRPAFRIRRDEGYIGVLVEDLIKSGVDEPYRIFTSRAENRLSLRYDNADERLQGKGRELGLVGDLEWNRYVARQSRRNRLRVALDETSFKRTDVEYAALSAMLDANLGDRITLAQLSKRPGVTADLVRTLLPEGIREDATETDLSTALADSLYAGYLDSYRASVDRLFHHDNLRIPSQISFTRVGGLSNEIVERLERARPLTFGEARRVPGLTPAALSALLVFLSASQKSF